MEVIFLLIAISIVAAVGFLAAFLWAVRTGQYDDDQTPHFMDRCHAVEYRTSMHERRSMIIIIEETYLKSYFFQLDYSPIIPFHPFFPFQQNKNVFMQLNF